MTEQTKTRWQEVATRAFPDKELIGDGPLAVITADGRVCLFAATPMYLDRENFDALTACLIADKQAHLVDLRDYREPAKVEPKVEPKPVQFPKYSGLYRIPGEGQDE